MNKFERVTHLVQFNNFEGAINELVNIVKQQEEVINSMKQEVKKDKKPAKVEEKKQEVKKDEKPAKVEEKKQAKNKEI